MQTTQFNQARRLKQQGFTLIELLIVVAIIGILAAVGVPQYQGYLDRSSIAACQTELSAFRGVVLSESAAEGSTTWGDYNDGVDFTFSSCEAIGSSTGTDINTQLATVANAFVDPDAAQVVIATGRSTADTLSIINGRIERTVTPSDPATTPDPAG